MQSISRETLLHMKWSKEWCLLCIITFAACSYRFHLKVTVHRRAVPWGIVRIISAPQGYHALQSLPSSWSPSHKSSLSAFKKLHISPEWEYLSSFFLNTLHVSYAAALHNRVLTAGSQIPALVLKDWLQIDLYSANYMSGKEHGNASFDIGCTWRIRK